MRRLQFRAIEAAFAHMPRYQRVAPHDLGNLFLLDFLAHFAMDGINHWGGAYYRAARIYAAGLHSVVVNLREHACAMLVNGARHTPVTGNNLRIESVNKLLIGPVAGMNRLFFRDD